MKLRLVYLGALLFIGTSLLSATAQIQLRVGKTRPIPTTLFGLNGNITAYDAPFDRANVVADLKQTGVALLRYPGGMIANHWNFENGWRR